MYPTYNYNPYNLTSNQSLIRVNGLEGAKAYQMPANSTVALFDNSEDIMYVKSTDMACFPTIRIFSFEELKNNFNNANNNFITHDDLDQLKQEIKSYVEQLISTTDNKPATVGQSAVKQPATTNGKTNAK